VTFWAADPTILGDGVATTQLYLRDRPGALTQRVSEGAGGVADAPTTGGLSGNGRIVVLASAAGNLDSRGTSGVPDLFIRLSGTPAPLPGAAATVTAGTTASVTLAGRFFDASTVVTLSGLGVRLDGSQPSGSGDLQLTLTADVGAPLGSRMLRFENRGPFGLRAFDTCACVSVVWTYAPPDPAPSHPNVVLIVTDDQRWDDVDEMPTTDARTDWARFTDMFVNEPMCCPSRASILTGRYSHHTGVETLQQGENLDESTTLATMLQAEGYHTGFMGKYLNGYPFDRGPYVPAGWDSWAAYDIATEYYDYTLIQQGVPVHYGTSEADYSTDIFASLARAFLRQAPTTEPFFLYVAPNAPHRPLIGLPHPARRYSFACPDFTFTPPPNFNAPDTVSEPAWMAASTPQSPESISLQEVATCRTLVSLDDAVASIFGELQASGRLDDTYVIITSDNGYSFGEHRLFGKGHLYDESVRVPLLVRGPDVVPGTQNRLTSNIDLVPTILDWTGASAPAGFLDGTSFADNLRGDDDIPDPTEILLRGCRTDAPSGGACGGYPDPFGLNWGLRTADFKYVEYATGEAQLFAVATDPYELTNLADNPAYASVRAALAARLDELRSS
jgi:arylsulfatase A-like enzyme